MYGGSQDRLRPSRAFRRFLLANWAERHKPTAAASTHLMLAWMMWVVVGSAMVGFGSWWLWSAAPGVAPWIAIGAALAGAVKSRLVLDGAARRVVDRIRSRGDGRCLGGFLSLQTWGLVVSMMVVGRVLRGSLAHGIVGPLYIAVGTALCLSSRITWRAWRQSRRGA
jgi:hypothetical protein